MGRPGQGDLGVQQAAQQGRERRGLDVPHVGVGHDADVRAQLVALALEERAPGSGCPIPPRPRRTRSRPPAGCRAPRARRAAPRARSSAGLCRRRRLGRSCAGRARLRPWSARTAGCPTARADRRAARRSARSTGPEVRILGPGPGWWPTTIGCPDVSRAAASKPSARSCSTSHSAARRVSARRAGSVPTLGIRSSSFQRSIEASRSFSRCASTGSSGSDIGILRRGDRAHRALASFAQVLDVAQPSRGWIGAVV